MKCPKCENELTASSNGSNRNYCKNAIRLTLKKNAKGLLMLK